MKKRINSRAKGCRGERELASLCRENGFPMRRGQQYCGANGDADCVSIEPNALDAFHIEAKWTEQFSLRDWLAKGKADSANAGKPLAIFHKYNHGPVTVTVLAETFFSMVRNLAGDELDIVEMVRSAERAAA